MIKRRIGGKILSDSEATHRVKNNSLFYLLLSKLIIYNRFMRAELFFDVLVIFGDIF